MTRRLVWVIGLLVLIIAFTSTIEIHAVTARTVIESDSCSSTQDSGYGNMAMISNVHAIDEGSYNLTFPRERFKHRFWINYPNGTPDFTGTPSDTIGNVDTPTIPEFPSFPMTLLFMATSLLGVTLFKMRVKRSSKI
jgi:hypothetical protein